MKKKQNSFEDQPPMPLNNNDPKLEAAYLNSYLMNRKEVPEEAKLIGVIEVLAFPVGIFQNGGDFISCVQERRNNE